MSLSCGEGSGPAGSFGRHLGTGFGGTLEKHSQEQQRQPENAESVFEAHFLFQPLSAAAQSPKYLTVYVVLDKALVSPCQLLFPCLGLTSVSVEMATFPTFYMDLFSGLKRYASCGFCRKEGT